MPLPPEPRTKVSPGEITRNRPNWNGGHSGTAYTLGTAYPPNLPETHKIGASDLNSHLPIGPAFFLEQNAQIQLDNAFLKNVIIKDSLIVYDGGPLILENVFFVNCTFVLRHQWHASAFAKAVFAANPSVSLTAAG